MHIGAKAGGHQMSTARTARTVTEGGDVPEQRVTPLELFFDLVFVFALTQVTGFLADHLTWVGMLQGAALLVVLWWAWGGYVWLTNAVPAEEVIPRAAGDAHRYGGHARGLAGRPRRLRPVRGALWLGLLRRAALARAPVRARHRRAVGGAPGHAPARAGLSGRSLAAHPGRIRGWLRPGRALGRGDRDRLKRVPCPRRVGLPGPRGALRGALCPHSHHSFGRVDRGYRRRSLGVGAWGGGRRRRRSRDSAGR